MALKDLGHIDFEEPYQRFRKHGLVIKDGAKMSKSSGNVVVPDHYIERWGADAFRLYLMFLGPYQEGGDCRDEGLSGPYGFLHRQRALSQRLPRHDREGDRGYRCPAIQHGDRRDHGVS